jgi:tetratricopeptide (TPR) repeat protein
VDLTTLIYGALIGLGLIATDVAIYAGSVVVEVTTAQNTETIGVDRAAVDSELDGVLAHISATQSLVHPPELVWSGEPGVGQALAEYLGMGKVADALKSELGVTPNRLSLSFYLEDGTLHALVRGKNRVTGVELEKVLIRNNGETLIAFVRRCALSAAALIAPYTTAIHLLGAHAVDKDFTDVIALAERVKALLPSTPPSVERSVFDNLLGLVALFKNDPDSAETAFATAMAEDPTNPVPFINAAFVDLQLNQHLQAANRMEQLLRLAPPKNAVLLASAYTTWAAALMGLHQLDGASRLLAAATEADPSCRTAFGLWAEERRLEGDPEAADLLERTASKESWSFQNYAELAVLYFHLAWQDSRSVEFSKFFNPALASVQ